MKKLFAACAVLTTLTVPLTPQEQIPAEDVVAFIFFAAENAFPAYGGGAWKRISQGNFVLSQQDYYGAPLETAIRVSTTDNCIFKAIRQRTYKQAPDKNRATLFQIDFSRMSLPSTYSTEPVGITSYAEARLGYQCEAALDPTSLSQKEPLACYEPGRFNTKLEHQHAPQFLNRLQKAWAYAFSNFCKSKPY